MQRDTVEQGTENLIDAGVEGILEHLQQLKPGCKWYCAANHLMILTTLLF